MGRRRRVVHVATLDELKTTEFGDGDVRRKHSVSPERFRTEGTVAKQAGELTKALENLHSSLSEIGDCRWPSKRVLKRNTHHDIAEVLLKLKKPIESLDQADLCVMEDPTWSRGHFRRGAALLDIAVASGLKTQVRNKLNPSQD